MEEEILDEQQLNENERNKQKLYKLVSSKDAILMVGAGSSASLYPRWDDLINMLEAEAENANFNENKENYLEFADKVKEVIGEHPYYAFLHEVFKPKEPLYLPFHQILCKLPFKGITTTNYDSILENALLSVTHEGDNFLCFEGFNLVKVNEFILSLNQSSNYSKRVLHLHGRYDMQESIILCGSEYEKKYGFSVNVQPGKLFDRIKSANIEEGDFEKLLLDYGYKWSLRRKVLWSLLATRRVVFIGFSMTDPYFKKMFEFVSDDLSTYRFDIHFLVLRITKETKNDTVLFAKLLKKKYGIETVFFEDTDDHKGLENFVTEMGNELLPKEEDEVVVVNENLEALPESEEITEQLFNLNEKQIFNAD